MPVTTKYDKRKDAVKGLSPGQIAANKEAAKPKKTTKQLDAERAKKIKGATIAAKKRQDQEQVKYKRKNPYSTPEDFKRMKDKKASIGKGTGYKNYKDYK